MKTRSGHPTFLSWQIDCPNEETVMTEDRALNWNEDKSWSEMDLFDLQNNMARGDLVEETADFLMRRTDEVRDKTRELRANARKKVSPLGEAFRSSRALFFADRSTPNLACVSTRPLALRFATAKGGVRNGLRLPASASFAQPSR
jgi:hypothetical protein